ncbi:MAG: ADP-forming succinate--CoA ligase subunit beta [Proteobacteria bacterium]|nr:ADP-forming succinate--CoA ligase subunit beta [Pseudomonadota bacterium]
MNIHEHQAKELLKAFGVPTLKGKAVFNIEESIKAAKELGNSCVVKAQIHAGGRGKAGGVIVCSSLQEVEKAAQTLLGKKLITHQTGPKGQLIKRLFIEESCEIEKEFYLSLTLDRKKERVTLVASEAGGMNIEEVALKNPEKVMTITIDPVVGYQDYIGRKIAFGLGLSKHVKHVQECLLGFYKAYVSLDANLIEINPFVLTKDQKLLALDAKMTFDDNALFRHPDIEKLRDDNEEDESERQARHFDLSYVKLDGSIGCMVNGAGLAMATMDIIKLHGEEPANFLDVGGGASKEKVSQAFKIILKDPHVKAILINIFGGIMRCDVIAQGITEAAKDVKLPIVVRLQGTNHELGQQILSRSHLAITSADDLEEAAKTVVRMVREKN